MNFTTTCKPFEETGLPTIQQLRDAGCRFVGAKKHGPLVGDDLIDAIGDADAVVADLDSYDENVFAALPHLKLVARWGVGFDAVDVEAGGSNGPGVYRHCESTHD